MTADPLEPDNGADANPLESQTINADPPALASSMTELAQILGVARTSVMRALRSGRIPRRPDGSFDVQACKIAWQENTRRGGQPSAVRAGPRAARTGHKDRGIEQVSVPADATAAVVDTLAAHGSPVEGEPTLRDAQTAEVILRAWKLRLDGHRLKGKYVERERAWDALATFTRTERDAFQAWPAAVAPGMASELGVADLGLMETVLARHVRAFLETLAAVPTPDELLPTT